MISRYLQKNKKELDTVIQTIRIYTQHVGIKFGIEEYAMLITKSGKRQTTEGTELPNQKSFKKLREKEK